MVLIENSAYFILIPLESIQQGQFYNYSPFDVRQTTHCQWKSQVCVVCLVYDLPGVQARVHAGVSSPFLEMPALIFYQSSNKNVNYQICGNSSDMTIYGFVSIIVKISIKFNIGLLVTTGKTMTTNGQNIESKSLLPLNKRQAKPCC